MKDYDTNFYIRDVTAYIPDGRIFIETLVRKGIITEQKMHGLEKKGIKSFPIFEGNHLHFFEKTLDPIMNSLGSEAKNIRYVYFTYRNQTLPYYVDILSYVRQKYQLSQDLVGCTVMDLECCNIFMAIEIGLRQLAQDKNDKALALFVCIDKEVSLEARVGHFDFVIGDSGTAFVISKAPPGDQILSLTNYFNVQQINISKPKADQGMPVDTYFFIDLVKIMEKTAQNAEAVLKDINLVIPHNASSENIEHLCKIMKLPQHKFYTDGPAHFGHSGNSDIFINYQEIIKNNLLVQGDLSMMLAIALGGGLSCALIRKE